MPTGPLGGRQASVIVGNARGGEEWWRADDECEKTGVGNMWWVCDQVSAKTRNRRGIAQVYLNHNDAYDQAVKKRELCNRGTEPCPYIGFATHLGRTMNKGLAIRPHGMITGFTNGLGWVVALDTGSPVKLTLEKIQVAEGDTLMLALPYPKGTEFKIDYHADKSCKSNCKHAFKKAKSFNEVRNSKVDTYYYDVSTGLLFVKVVQQKIKSLDFKSKFLNLKTFTREGISIPYKNSKSKISISASGCPLNRQDRNYCKYSYRDLDINPCSLIAMNDAILTGIDECIVPTKRSEAPRELRATQTSP